MPVTQGSNQEASSDNSGWLESVLTDYKFIASAMALLAYGIVRVAYDGFYNRLGISPEDVGLSESAMLARAALLFVLIPFLALAGGMLWVAAVAAAVKRRRGQVGSSLVACFALAVWVGALLVFLFAQAHVEDRTLIYYCLRSRCTVQILSPQGEEAVRQMAERVVSAPAWLVALPSALMALVAIAGLLAIRLANRKASDDRRRRVSIALFTAFSAVSLLAGLAMPLIIDLTDLASFGTFRESHPSFVESHPSLFKWAIFLLLLGALIAGLLAALDALVRETPVRSRWSIASFVVSLPLVLGFFAPDTVLFVEDQGITTIFLAFVLWSAVLVLIFIFPWPLDVRSMVSPVIAVCVAAVICCMFLLARESGIHTANQVASGYGVSGGWLVSVRVVPVCIGPAADAKSLKLRRPLQYLGEANGRLVLYDYEREQALDAPLLPANFVLRIPVGDLSIQTAIRQNVGGILDSSCN